MHRLLRIIAASSALVSAGAQGAKEVGTIEGWTIYRDDESKSCRMIGVYENDEALIVRYDASEKDAVVTFTEKQATSLKDGDKRSLDILFVQGGAVDDGWEDTDFRVMVASDGQRWLTSQTLTSAFLADFGKASTIAFFVNERKIDSYNLKGSSKAVAALQKCAMEAAGLNPLDPFAQ